MNNNEWMDIAVLEDYLDGKLDGKAMHQVEKMALDDPFVAEALAGLSESPKRTQSLSLLQKQLQERLALKPVEKKRWQVTSQRLSIAAAAAVLFVTASLLFWMKDNRYRAQLSGQAHQKETGLAPARVGSPQPVGGITSYQAYLTANNRLTKSGLLGKEVELVFTIDQQGLPAGIKIIKGINEIQNAEAIRLVKEGPKWRTSGQGNTVSLKIKF